MSDETVVAPTEEVVAAPVEEKKEEVATEEAKPEAGTSK